MLGNKTTCIFRLPVSSSRIQHTMEVKSFLYFVLSISYLIQVEEYIDQYQCYFLNYRFQNCHYKKNPRKQMFFNASK